MAFRPLGDPPGRDKACNDAKSLLLNAFPAKFLEAHFRAGYSFRSDACTSAFAYDPDYCLPGDVKMDPEGFGPERDAVVGMIQSAFNCSPVGETLDRLREVAEETLENNLWRAIEADLVANLAAFPPVVFAGALEAKCALAEASQFLATNGNCGKGIIVGPYDWFNQLGTTHLIWNGTYHTDLVGNLVIPLSVDNNTVYAFDSNVDIRISDILLMDELAPSIRSVNDRIVRAEQIYTVAIDPCVVGSFTVSACCDCASGGGGGGGGNVVVTNLCSCVQDVNVVSSVPLNVTVSNFPVDSDFDVEELLLCDDNGTFIHRSLYNAETGAFISATNTTLAGAPYIPVGTVTDCSGNAGTTPITASRHFDTLPGNPWTPALVTGTLTSITYTVLTGTATVTDSTGVVIAGLPIGLTSTWQNDLEQSLTGAPLSIAADPGSRLYVSWTEV